MTKTELGYVMDKGLRKKIKRITDESEIKKENVRLLVEKDNKEAKEILSKEIGKKYNYLNENIFNYYNHKEYKKITKTENEEISKLRAEKETKMIEFIVMGLKKEATIEAVKKYCEIK